MMGKTPTAAVAFSENLQNIIIVDRRRYGVTRAVEAKSTASTVVTH
jgi:hypothetical protein